jgi:hypothetical protein
MAWLEALKKLGKEPPPETEIDTDAASSATDSTFHSK